MVCDGLTKPHPNQALEIAYQQGVWCLKEDESFQQVRALARERQKVSKKNLKERRASAHQETTLTTDQDKALGGVPSRPEEQPSS